MIQACKLATSSTASGSSAGHRQDGETDGHDCTATNTSTKIGLESNLQRMYPNRKPKPARSQQEQTDRKAGALLIFYWVPKQKLASGCDRGRHRRAVAQWGARARLHKSEPCGFDFECAPRRCCAHHPIITQHHHPAGKALRRAHQCRAAAAAAAAPYSRVLASVTSNTPTPLHPPLVRIARNSPGPQK